MKKVGKILLIILIVLAAIGLLGYIAYKIWGDALIAKAVAGKPGNAAEYDVSNVTLDESSPLNGKKAIYLGSSVTYGSGSCQQSFVEFLQAKDGVEVLAKEAVSGTTLVTQDETSYIPRMETIDTSLQPDVFVCQLSTNDATQEMPFGEISDSEELADFDTSTIAGAIEYIIVYAQDTWNCPVVFYTGTQHNYDSENYGKMVDLLLQIQEKYGITVIDQWNDAELNDITEDQYKLYMVNAIHPTKAGYLEWWLPQFEEGLAEAMQLQ